MDATEKPEKELFRADDDIAKLAVRNNLILNGATVDGTVHESQMDEEFERIYAKAHGDEGEDEDMGVEEMAEERFQQYRGARQGKMSDPDEWAEVHYGHEEWDSHARMAEFSHANQLRLEIAVRSLRCRDEEASAEL